MRSAYASWTPIPTPSSGCKRRLASESAPGAVRTSRRGKQLVPVSRRARRTDRHASKWAFAELQEMLTYQATLAGSLCIKVEADYTSLACPRCGFTSRANRPQHGLLFACQQCYYALHADLVGPEIWRYERWSSGRTGWLRSSCQMPPM